MWGLFPEGKLSGSENVVLALTINLTLSFKARTDPFLHLDTFLLFSGTSEKLHMLILVSLCKEGRG